MASEVDDFTADKYVAKEFLDEDPRVALTLARMSEEREPRPRGYSCVEMHEGRQYSVGSIPTHVLDRSQ